MMARLGWTFFHVVLPLVGIAVVVYVWAGAR